MHTRSWRLHPAPLHWCHPKSGADSGSHLSGCKKACAVWKDLKPRINMTKRQFAFSYLSSSPPTSNSEQHQGYNPPPHCDRKHPPPKKCPSLQCLPAWGAAASGGGRPEGTLSASVGISQIGICEKTLKKFDKIPPSTLCFFPAADVGLLSQTSGDLSPLPSLMSLPLSHFYCSLVPTCSPPAAPDQVIGGHHCASRGSFVACRV